MGFFSSRKSRVQQLPKFTPQQQELQSTLLSQIAPLLQQMQQKKETVFDFDPIAKQARTQFSQETIPGLAERFTGMGEGAQGSSAFQSELGKAGAGLEESLASMQSQIGLQKGLKERELEQSQQQNVLRSLLGGGMAPSFENIYTPRSPGFLEQGLMSFISNLGGGGGGGGSGGGSGGGGSSSSLMKLLAMFK